MSDTARPSREAVRIDPATVPEDQPVIWRVSDDARLLPDTTSGGAATPRPRRRTLADIFRRYLKIAG